MIRIRRVYDPVESEDGLRILVDRLWPRGLSKEKANLYLWLKEVAPSTDLRQWFDHDPSKWDKLRSRYILELKMPEAQLQHLRMLASGQNVTLLFAARDVNHNEAVVIRDVLTERMPP